MEVFTKSTKTGTKIIMFVDENCDILVKIPALNNAKIKIKGIAQNQKEAKLTGFLNGKQIMIPVPIDDFKIIETFRDEKRKENYNKSYKEIHKEMFDLAKSTGKKQLICQDSVPCNNHKLECNLDLIRHYAMPNGSTKNLRDHTF